jgi:hypothetical protein
MVRTPAAYEISARVSGFRVLSVMRGILADACCSLRMSSMYAKASSWVLMSISSGSSTDDDEFLEVMVVRS